MWQEIKERIGDRYTPLDLIEMLNITVEELADCFEDRILNNAELLEEIGELGDD